MATRPGFHVRDRKRRPRPAQVTPLLPGRDRARAVTAWSRALDSGAALPADRLSPWPWLNSQIARLQRGTHVRSRDALAGNVMLAATLMVAALLFFGNIGHNPVSLFCDEAEIALESIKLLHFDAEINRIPFFYQHLEYNHLGVLPLYATAPFIAIFGVTDSAIRGSSAVLTFLSIIAVYQTLKRLSTPYPAVAIALFATLPIMVHIGRINLGHAPSFLAIALGYWSWVAASTSVRRWLPFLAGALIGVSAYGNSAFYIFAPMVLGGIVIAELIYHRKHWSGYRSLLGCIVAFGIVISPVAYRALADDTFFGRMTQKDENRDIGWFSSERLSEMLNNYSKYFSFDYLFRVGEFGMPGSFITRHSVMDTGEITWMVLPIALFSLVAIYWLRGTTQFRYFFPWFVVAVLYPLPDLITTTALKAPYSFAIAGAALCIPFMAGAALHGVPLLLQRLHLRAAVSKTDTAGAAAGSRLVGRSLKQVERAIAVVLLVAILAGGLRFYTGPYHDYRARSADYWGWQFGPKAMIDYFTLHEEAYDQFIMNGDFNGAYVFLDLYIRDDRERSMASIGDLYRFDPTVRQLFGMRFEQWENLPADLVATGAMMQVIDVIPYPDGSPAMVMLEMREGAVVP